MVERRIGVGSIIDLVTRLSCMVTESAADASSDVELPKTMLLESTSATNESVLKVPLDYRKQAAGVIKSHDREVGELRFHLFGFLMCIAATGARALKSMLQGILHSSEGVRHGCTVAVMVLSKFYVSKVGIF
ncbi:hypothetical protein IGI04_035187 [Brassica rapa subsp. trilocularis]|uniref:Uncharacterized protein n=1 Tax=Brassica rapa subsp. trilocularis TaxID=1813537 RepID=A0ABQ7LAW4_BRACM|nr:hypothetical protein IGI04_035187 [Brassica rapa subsp. trilocularis]